jgi:hypothetical protein
MSDVMISDGGCGEGQTKPWPVYRSTGQGWGGGVVCPWALQQIEFLRPADGRAPIGHPELDLSTRPLTFLGRRPRTRGTVCDF